MHETQAVKNEMWRNTDVFSHLPPEAGTREFYINNDAGEVHTALYMDDQSPTKMLPLSGTDLSQYPDYQVIVYAGGYQYLIEGNAMYDPIESRKKGRPELVDLGPTNRLADLTIGKPLGYAGTSDAPVEGILIMGGKFDTAPQAMYAGFVAGPYDPNVKDAPVTHLKKLLHFEGYTEPIEAAPKSVAKERHGRKLMKAAAAVALTAVAIFAPNPQGQHQPQHSKGKTAAPVQANAPTAKAPKSVTPKQERINKQTTPENAQQKAKVKHAAEYVSIVLRPGDNPWTRAKQHLQFEHQTANDSQVRKEDKKYLRLNHITAKQARKLAVGTKLRIKKL